MQNRGDVCAGQAFFVELPGDLPGPCGCGAQSMLCLGDGLAGGISRLVQAAAYLRLDDHDVVSGVAIGQGSM